jgi:putative transposase
MGRKRLAAEQIVTKLRQIEILQGQGKMIAVACRDAETTEQNCYRWRKEYGGLGVDQTKRLKQLRPSLQYVQFVDGDCVVVDGWLWARIGSSASGAVRG